MKSEYLIFNIIIIAGPALWSLLTRNRAGFAWKTAITACLIVMGPYILWDILATGRHWSFNPAYITGIQWFGLPIEEWLFFLSVPLACLTIWHSYPRSHTTPAIWPHVLIGSLTIAGAIAAVTAGKGYTALMLTALTVWIAADVLSGCLLLTNKWTRIHFLVVSMLTLIFNGYLTNRPVVLYHAAAQLNIRLMGIPIEDFGYGWSLIALTTLVYEYLLKKRHRHP